MTTPEIYELFARGGMKYMDAIRAVMAVDGCTYNEAVRVVSEWADEEDNRQ